MARTLRGSSLGNGERTIGWGKGTGMKVLRLGDEPGIDRLKVANEPRSDSPGPGEILVRVHASSLNYHDLNVAIGRLPSAPGRILLTDGAGQVEAVGEGVSEFGVGDAVVSCFFPQWPDGEPTTAGFSQTPGDGVDGYGREYVIRPANWFTHSPSHLEHIQTATITTAGVTAWRALVVEGEMKAGDCILLLGTGGVSIIALQLAKAMGATVIITSSSDEKLDRARALGADHVINYKQHPQWASQVLACTDGRGVDLVIEVGGPGTLAQSIAACRIGGRIALIGVLTGISGEVPTAALMGRQQRLSGITVGSRRHQQDLVRALETTGIEPVIDTTFPMDRIVDAFQYELSATHFGKIGIII
jgi:NADPH:quinone reductase-like Zn-dependent oxidoreductase